MEYKLLTYEDTSMGTNIGDYIQSIAARQLLPHVDGFVNREHLNEVSGDKFKLIMNGWYMHHPENFPPAESIIPLFVAFHINSSHANKILKPETCSYLKKYEPIGCRDTYTKNILESKGIKAYLSGCLTLTLDCYKVDDRYRNNKILIVDPIFNLFSFREAFSNPKFTISYLKHGLFMNSFNRLCLINKIIDKKLLFNASWRHHMILPNKISEKKRFELAEKLIKEYARARCVITSRIHCALPCLALGTPVIFINSFNVNDTSNISRLNGVTNLFNKIDLDVNKGIINSDIKLKDGKITEESIIPNKNEYLKYIPNLKKQCIDFIK